jgi:hypothetical protein
MIGVVWCALVFTLHRAMGSEGLAALLISTLGPICGALAQRCWGGRGILGGMIGGIVSYVCFGVGAYMWAYHYPEPNTVDYLGPLLTLMILSIYGAVVGLAGGILVWSASLIPENSDKR